LLLLGLVATLALGVAGQSEAQKTDVAFPTFKMQEIETGLKVGYAVLLVDVNADQKTDIVVVDTVRVVWYENPTWKRRTIIEGQTRPDNVCIAAHDIDGDGQLDFALGADWKPFNTKSGGTLQWLKRGKSLDEPWTVYPIAEEPTVHRIRFADVLGEGKPQLINVPLMGKEATQKNNWLDGQGVRIIAYKTPKDPAKERWQEVVLNQDLHVIHNFQPVPSADGKRMDVLCASYEGVSLLTLNGGTWLRKHIGEGNQANPKGNRGASEIKQGKLKSGVKPIATIEPWHGNQVVVYTPPPDPALKFMERRVIDDQLRWGHGVWFADLDSDGDDELIIGVRDNPGAGDKFNLQRGVRIYRCVDGKGTKWARQVVDNGGVAVEDLAAADLNGDGKIDIVAAGRQTFNVRIYWNEGVKK
jgi:hypothetical protein